jgi:hypothetical protein
MSNTRRLRPLGLPMPLRRPPVYRRDFRHAIKEKLREAAERATSAQKDGAR